MDAIRLGSVRMSVAATLMLAGIGVAGPGQAQFFDLLKDKATEMVRKQVNGVTTPSSPQTQSTGTPGDNGAGNGQGMPPPGADNAAPQTLQAYQGYDFVPGDTILFEDHFEGDVDGEFPEHWNQIDSQGAINLVAGVRALALTAPGFTQVSPLIKPAQYLGDAWTLEFDTYPTRNGPGPRIYFYNAPGDVTQNRGEFGHIRLDSSSELNLYRQGVPNPLRQTYPIPLTDTWNGRWHHIALAYNKGRLKVYIDQYRVYALQNLGYTPRLLSFARQLAGTQTEPTVIANLRIASGANMRMTEKKFTDAKLVTHGINFDTDKAVIRPESAGTLNMVANILKNNPDVRFEVQGHTDSSGSSSRNLALSQQRADAVRQQLLNLGIEGTRLTSRGLGDTKPVSDNATLEGRANNRRVEFVTQK